MPRATAVCLAGLLHSLPNTVEKIQRFLVEALEADLFLTGPTLDSETWLQSLVLFGRSLQQIRLENENVTAALYSQGAKSPFLPGALQIRGNWLGCLERERPENQGKDMRRKGSGLCLIYGQKQCMLMIQDWEAKNSHRYQRVVFSRPDFHWTAPHVPPSFLSMEHIWIMDGQDNGGLNDRHWIFPRSLMEMMLGAWDSILDGVVLQMQQAMPSLPWWGAETFFGLRLLTLGFTQRIRRVPVPAYLECSNRYSRKDIDTSALSLNDTGRLSEWKLRCPLGGPKYKHEHEEALSFARCFTETLSDRWSWRMLWDCWCDAKYRRGML